MSIINNVDKFIENNRPFIGFMKKWEEGLKAISLEDIIKEAGGPEKVALVSVDLIEGFCRVGPLASDRVKEIISPVVELMKKAHALGIRDIILTQDSHPEDSPEFGAFPPHCVRGTKEAETIREFKELPFFDSIRVVEKESISSGVETNLEEIVEEKDFNRVIVVGDCTDLCTYQLAMFLRLHANANGHGRDIILPVNAVETYDMPVSVAEELGAMAHPGDLFHIMFIYHMALNGIKVVKEVI